MMMMMMGMLPRSQNDNAGYLSLLSFSSPPSFSFFLLHVFLSSSPLPFFSVLLFLPLEVRNLEAS